VKSAVKFTERTKMKIHNIRFLPVAFFILVGMGTLADAAVLAPSPGFVSLTNPTGRPECIVLPNNCTGIPTINPQIPVTSGSVATSLGALRVDPPPTLDIPATLRPLTLTALVNPMPPSLANQTITNPEPTTLLLVGSGLSGMFLIRKFARRRAD
jgi:hypothetical protein